MALNFKNAITIPDSTILLSSKTSRTAINCVVYPLYFFFLLSQSEVSSSEQHISWNTTQTKQINSATGTTVAQ